MAPDGADDTRRVSTVVWVGTGVALVTAATLHVTGAGRVDPLRTVISDYVQVPGGYALLAVAALALAGAVAALAAGVRAVAPSAGRLPANLLVSGSIALMVAAVFPTNLPGTPAGVVAEVHRAAGGWAYLSIPLAGWLLAWRAPSVTGWATSARTLRIVAGGVGLIAAGYLLSHILIVIGGSPFTPYLGGAERVVCAVMIALLLVMARACKLSTDRSPDVRTAAALAPPNADLGRLA